MTCQRTINVAKCSDLLLTPAPRTQWLSIIIDTAEPTRRIRRGCNGRPCRRPTSSDLGVRSRGWERRSGPCAGPCRRGRCGPLKYSQFSNPAALAIAFTRRAIWDSESPNTFSPPPAPAGRMAERACMAAGVMATVAPWASASVLERTTVMRPEPSSHCCTSPQVKAAASLRLSPASESTATSAASDFSLSAACSGVSKPRPRLRGWTAVRRMTARTSAARAPDWRWGFESLRPHPFKEALTPESPAGRL